MNKFHNIDPKQNKNYRIDFFRSITYISYYILHLLKLFLRGIVDNGELKCHHKISNHIQFLDFVTVKLCVFQIVRIKRVRDSGVTIVILFVRPYFTEKSDLLGLIFWSHF